MPRIRSKEMSLHAFLETKEEEFQDKFPVFFSLIKYLLIFHKLPGWKLRLDNAKQRAGLCNYQEKCLSFSHHLLANLEISFEKKANIILHEIAHAMAGPYTQHGPVWKKIAKKIGCDGKTYHDLVLKTPKYVYTCPCGTLSLRRFRKSTKAYRCRSCGDIAEEGK